MKTDVKTLRLLMLEDMASNAELMKCALEDAGYRLDWVRVDNEEDYRAALDDTPDVILSDYKLPDFNGLQALSILHERKLDIPFILVSGTIGEEIAAESIKQGAADYLLKDRLGRLPAAVASALEGRRLRVEKNRVEEELLERELQLGAFLEHSPALTFIKDTTGRYQYVNRRFNEAFGFRPGQIFGKRDDELFPAAQATVFRENDRLALRAGGTLEFEEVADQLDGPHTSIVAKFPLHDVHGAVCAIGGIATDITARKQAEQHLQATFEQAAVGISNSALDGRFLRVNQKLCDMVGYTSEELQALTYVDITHPEDLLGKNGLRAQVLAGANVSTSTVREKRYLRKDGSVIWVAIAVSLVRKSSGEPDYFVTIIDEITQRKVAEAAMRESERFARSTINGLSQHLCVIDESGTIIAVNKAWRDFALANGGIVTRMAEGANYLTACDSVSGEDAAEGANFAAGIRDVLAGERDSFELEYPCHAPGQQRWFIGRVMHMHDAGAARAVITHGDSTSRRRAEENLRTSEREFRTMFELAAVGKAESEVETGRFLRVNSKLCQITGYSEKELLGMTFMQLTDPEDRARNLEEYKRPVAGEDKEYLVEKRYVRKDGETIWVNVASNFVRDADGKPRRNVAVVQDITERKAQEQKIVRLSRIQAVLSGINSLIVRTRDRQHLFRGACQIAIEQGGFDMAWIGLLDAETRLITGITTMGTSTECFNSTSPSADAKIPSGQGAAGLAIREKRAIYTNDLLAEPGPVTVRRQEVIRLGYRSRVVLPLLVQGSAVGVVSLYTKERNFFNEDELTLLDELAGDISFALEYIENEEKLHHLAYHDVLTGLPNRVLFRDRLEQTIAKAERNKRAAAVLMLDLHRFKIINDTLGPEAGDQLLKLVAERLSLCTRRGDSVARMGGDEFAVVLSDLAAADDAGMVAQKIMNGLAAPFDLGGHETFVTAGIGISVYPTDGTDVDSLIKAADTAMHGAKKLGFNAYQYYTAEMNRHALKKMQLETRLRHAVERGEFVLHYQPKVVPASGEVVGLEALLRWQSPEGRLVSPAEFIPILEESGLIVPVGEWVLEAACAQISAWQRAGVKPVPVAINISGRQFQQRELDKSVAQMLAKYCVDPRWLEIELTESSLMDKPDEAIEILKNLKVLGIQISVDDFGTGYSSLSYLKRFPLDALKIDRSFVRDITVNPDDAAIACAIVTMAHSLNLKVIAEGVETAEQLRYLSIHRCDEIQGYLFSKPLPPAECTALLAVSRRFDVPALVDAAEEAPAVLLVDDDRASLDLLQSELAKEGYPILAANNAHDALAMLARHRVRVIVSDQNMPGLSGIELFKRVKRMYPDIERIMLSGENDFEMAAAAINEAGVCKLLLKYRDDHQLGNEIRKAYWRELPQRGQNTARSLIAALVT